MNIILNSALVCLFCIDYYAIYYKTTEVNKQLTIKQKAYILSTKSSLTLVILSLIFNYQFIKSNYNLDKYLLNLGSTSNFVVQLSVCNFLAYLIMDCYIGNKEYHKYMCTLSGYTHHFVYIIVNCLSIFTKASPMYLLYMISELPTVILSLGSYNKKFRNDSLFGLTFFTTRICYHIFLTYMFRKHSLLLGVALSALSLHIYWFWNWVKKYLIAKTKLKKEN